MTGTTVSTLTASGTTVTTTTAETTTDTATSIDTTSTSSTSTTASSTSPAPLPTPAPSTPAPPPTLAPCADDDARIIALASNAGLIVSGCADVQSFCEHAAYGRTVRGTCPATCGSCTAPVRRLADGKGR